MRISRLAFLLYVVAETLEGREAEITEHQIGVQVFDRRPGYSTVEDNIVRNYARQLRRRLAEHFAGEGGSEPLRIDIPLGAYVPVFVPASEGRHATEVRSFPVSVNIHAKSGGPREAAPARTRDGTGSAGSSAHRSLRLTARCLSA